MRFDMMELTHYVVVFAVLMATWLPIMNYWHGDLPRTAITAFVVFILADKIAHKYILGEDF